MATGMTVLLALIDFIELMVIAVLVSMNSAVVYKEDPEMPSASEIDDDEDAQRYVKSIEEIMHYDPYK